MYSHTQFLFHSSFYQNLRKIVILRAFLSSNSVSCIYLSPFSSNYTSLPFHISQVIHFYFIIFIYYLPSFIIHYFFRLPLKEKFSMKSSAPLNGRTSFLCDCHTNHTRSKKSTRKQNPNLSGSSLRFRSLVLERWPMCI